jgi:capsular polysaccharide biosynthesis protein
MENELKDFFNLIKRKKQTIMSVVLVFLVVAMIISFAQPLKYSSESRLLVVQNFPEETDPYAISKSNEYLTSILSKVISSNLFYEDIMDSGFLINRDYFSKNKNIKKEMKNWRKTVYAKPISDSGIIDIKVYHQNKEQLVQIANAINFILKSKHNLYHGAGNSITIKIIDKPIISTWPTKPNVLLNIFVAFIFALILSLSYIYLFPEKKYDIRLWPKKKNKKDDLASDFQFTENEFKNNWSSIGEVIKERESLKTPHLSRETGQAKDYEDTKNNKNDYYKNADKDNRIDNEINKENEPVKTKDDYEQALEGQLKNKLNNYEDVKTVDKNNKEDEYSKETNNLNNVQGESSERVDSYEDIKKDNETKNEEMDVPDFNNKISETEEDDIEVISKKGDMRNLF